MVLSRRSSPAAPAIALGVLSVALLPWAGGHCAGEEGTKPAVPQHRQTWEEFMAVDTAAPIEELAPPADAQERLAAFAKRDSPEEVERLAKRLWKLWDLTDRHASNNSRTTELDPEKAAVRALFEKNDYAGALAAYRTYLVHKCQILFFAHPATFTSNDFKVRRGSNPVLTQRYEALAELLMHDAYQVPTTKQTVRIGPPGLLHWDWKARDIQNIWDNSYKPAIEYFCGSDYDKLWWKFVDTKDHKYLDKWVGYLDDYTLNDHFLEDLSALNIDLGKQGMSDIMCFFQALVEISNATPMGDTAVPATTVARMMLHLLEVVIPQCSFYNRQQSNNHSPSATAGFLLTSDFVSDFTLGDKLVIQGRRQFETYGTMDARVDGSGPGRLPEYVMFEYRSNIPTLDFFREGDYDWFTPMLNREYRDRMVARARFMIHVVSPQGEYIDSQKNDDRRRIGFEGKVGIFNSSYPEAFNDPDITRIVNRILHNMSGPDWRGKYPMPAESALAHMGTGGGANDEPSYSSVSFPYDRINIMSNGFDPKNDQYGVLLGSSTTGRGDAMMKENKGTNHFVISAFDRDIFRNGASYAYNYLSSPILVDDQQQFNGAGEGPTGRRGQANYGLDPIDPDRIHYSADFDVAESVYNWAYVTTGEHDPEYYDYHTKLDRLKHAIWGVSHRRIVQFVKKHGLWIVTDLMRSDKPHSYAQQWWLGKKNEQAPDGWLEDQIHLDPAKHAFISEVPGNVNFSMYHVGPVELDAAAGSPPPGLVYDPVAEKPEHIDSFTGARSDRHEGWKYIQLRGTWQSQGGRSQLVTVIYPRKTVDQEVVKMVPLQRPDGQEDGFQAALPDGSTVSYIASMEKPAALQIGDISATAEALLVLTDADGAHSGTVLGCSAIHGEGLTRTSSDFQFAIRPSGVQTQAITPPIKPVEIAPGLNVFADSIAVTLSEPTPGTEIRYSIDGEDPTLASPLYTGPLTFTNTVLLKARAFRSGLTTMPADTPTGTDMTSVAYAVYTKEAYHDAKVDQAATKPGLHYDYYQAKWPYFIYGIDPNIDPLRSGEVPALFDTTAKDPAVATAFAFVYSGYLDVPADGVYTIYAPDEFTQYRPLAGYDLDVSLGYAFDTDENGKQRHPGAGALDDWYPATRHHAYGTWSVALRKGLQPIRVYFADMRPGATLQYLHYTYTGPGLNVPGLTKIIWDGDVPTLQISGPGLPRQSIPKEWLRHD